MRTRIPLWPRPGARRTRAALAALPLALALALTGCGSDDDGGSEIATVDDQPSSSSSATESETPPLSEEDQDEVALLFSQCMRDNGVDGYPDPESGGGHLLDQETMNDPDREAAEEACEEYREQLRAGGEPPAGDREEMRANRLEMAQCMRDNGVEDFPDPQPPGTGGERGQVLDGEIAADPDFDAAMEECRDILGSQGVIGNGEQPPDGGDQ